MLATSSPLSHLSRALIFPLAWHQTPAHSALLRSRRILGVQELSASLQVLKVRALKQNLLIVYPNLGIWLCNDRISHICA